MKPRLKLHLNGQISVVQASPSGWNAYEAKSFIRQHYGTLGAAASALQVPYWALQQALHEHMGAQQAGGHVGRCRQLLGLVNRPTSRSIAAAHRADACRRAAA